MGSRRPRLLLFDPFAGGHHADHVRWIADAWLRREMPGELVASVAPRLVEQHPDLLNLQSEGRFRLSPLPLAADGIAQLGLARSAIENLRLYRHAVATYRPDKALALYMDHLQVSLAFRARLPLVPLSGILFRPSLHYASLGSRPASVGERAWSLRKKLILRSALHHRRLDTVFSLDPTAVPAIELLAPARVRVLPLPDPADLGSVSRTADVVRVHYGVEPHRILLVLFGALDERKGVFTTLDALAGVPAHVAKRVSLVLAGRPGAGVARRLRAVMEALERTSEAQVVLHDAFIPDDAVQDLIGAADVVLAPYDRHVGSSGILMRAAAAGRPVLSQDWGLMGWQVRTHGLGRTADTSSAQALTEAIVHAVENPQAGFDAARAAAFASANTVEKYTSTIFDALLRGEATGVEPSVDLPQGQ